MKTIELAKISRYELITILFAARWQMQDWAKNTEDQSAKQIWIKAINGTKYLESFMKDHPSENYFLHEKINEF